MHRPNIYYISDYDFDYARVSETMFQLQAATLNQRSNIAAHESKSNVENLTLFQRQISVDST